MAEYIDKDTAITAVGEAIADGASWFDALERIPPADVRPVVRGRWEIQSCGMGGENVFCSVCKCGSGRPYWPFCPMCGADMRSEKEEH